MQSGDDKAGIRHYVELCILLVEGGPAAGGEQGRLRAGVGDLGWLCAAGKCSPGRGKNFRWAAGPGGESIKESRLADLFHDITSSPQDPQGNDNIFLFYTEFREHWMKYEYRWVLFFYHKSHHSCNWQFQKLPWPFSPLLLVGKITWKCYSSNSLDSGQMPDFFHFITAPSSPSSFSLFCGQEFLLLPKATVLMGSLKVKTQRKKQRVTQKRSTYAIIAWLWYCC